MGVSFYPGLWGERDSPPCLILTVFTIWTEWAATLNVYVIYPNCMIYVWVQFCALCPDFSEVILSFNTKSFIMPHTMLLLKEQSSGSYTKGLICSFYQRNIHKVLLKEQSCIFLHLLFISVQISLPHFHIKVFQSSPILY